MQGRMPPHRFAQRTRIGKGRPLKAVVFESPRLVLLLGVRSPRGIESARPPLDLEEKVM